MKSRHVNALKVSPRKWMAGAVKHPGALHKQLGIPVGQKIPVSVLRRAAKKKGKLGRRARLALIFRRYSKG